MNSVTWKCEIATLDYHRYLPMFFEGIREKQDPYKTLSIMG